MEKIFHKLFSLLMNERGEAGEGEGNGNWFDDLPEDVREWQEVKDSDTPEKFYKQMGDLRSHMGQSVRIPGEDASAEDMVTFHDKVLKKVPGLILRPDMTNKDAMDLLYTQLGKPEDADKYEVPEFENKNLDLSPVEAFKAVAHKHGLNQVQFKGIVSEMTDANLVKAELANKNIEDNRKFISDEWGQAHDQNYKIIENIAVKTGAPKTLIEAIKNKVLDRGSAVWLYSLSKAVSGEGMNLVLDKGEAAIITPAEAKLQISEILNNKKHPYWIPSDPAHKVAKGKLRDLYLLADPKGGKGPPPGTVTLGA